MREREHVVFHVLSKYVGEHRSETESFFENGVEERESLEVLI